jgi:hypothetical protein
MLSRLVSTVADDLDTRQPTEKRLLFYGVVGGCRGCFLPVETGSTYKKAQQHIDKTPTYPTSSGS